MHSEKDSEAAALMLLSCYILSQRSPNAYLWDWAVGAGVFVTRWFCQLLEGVEGRDGMSDS